METREYFEKVMQDYNQNRNGRSLRRYCKDEAIENVCFHKLAFRVGENVTKDKENYYNYILTEYGRI